MEQPRFARRFQGRSQLNWTHLHKLPTVATALLTDAMFYNSITVYITQIRAYMTRIWWYWNRFEHGYMHIHYVSLCMLQYDTVCVFVCMFLCACSFASIFNMISRTEPPADCRQCILWGSKRPGWTWPSVFSLPKWPSCWRKPESRAKAVGWKWKGDTAW